MSDRTKQTNVTSRGSWANHKRPAIARPALEKLFTIDQIAAELGASYSAIRRLANFVPKYRFGDVIRIDAAGVVKIRDMYAEASTLKERAYARGERDEHRRVALAMMDSIDCKHIDWTYVVRAAAPIGLVKIGRARNLVNRVWGLDRGSPVAVTLLALAAGGDYEAALQRRYLDRRIRGEWFETSVGDELEAAWGRREADCCLRCVLEGHCGERGGNHRRRTARPDASQLLDILR